MKIIKMMNFANKMIYLEYVQWNAAWILVLGSERVKPFYYLE